MVNRFSAYLPFFCILFSIIWVDGVWADSLQLDATHGGDGSAWGLTNCDSCHLLNFIHDNTQAKLRELVQEKEYASCSGCHGSNGTEQKRVCVMCHNDDDLPYASHQSGSNSHHFQSLSNGQSAPTLTDQQCLTCHEDSDMDSVFDINQDLTRFYHPDGYQMSYKNESEFCLACHNRDYQPQGFEISGKDYRDPLLAMADNYAFIDKHGRVAGSGQRTYSGLREGYKYGEQLACTECHAMHGTDNAKLIIDNIYNGAWGLSKTLKQQNISVQTHAGNDAQLCVLCHVSEQALEQSHLDTGNGLKGVHQVQGSCLTCHRHGMAVQTGL